MSIDSIILAYKVIFSEYGLPNKIMSDVGGNFILYKFKQLWTSMNIQQATLSSYHHQRNGQVEASIKFIEHTVKKYIETNDDTYIALLQIKAIPLEPG